MISWLERHMLPCAYKSLFGIECPGCGMQRSFIQLLEGKVIESFNLYPPLIPVLSWLLFSFLFFFNTNLVNRRFLKFYSIAVALIVFVNYAIRLLY